MCSQSNFCIKIAMSVTLSHSQQSNIRDKIAVISAKIFCEQKYFLVTRIPRYTIICCKVSPATIIGEDSH